MRHVGNQACGSNTEKVLHHVKATPHAVPSKLLAPSPGLQSWLPPVLALADQTQAVIQAVVSHVQAMLERFE